MHKLLVLASLHPRDCPIYLAQALKKASPILVTLQNGGFVDSRHHDVMHGPWLIETDLSWRKVILQMC